MICKSTYPDLHKKVEDFCHLYGLAEEAYKSVQAILLQIDDKIHNEFRYCSRALRELLQDLTVEHTTERAALEKLQRAEHAIKNALNDSVDLIVGYASLSIREMASIDSGKELIVFIHNLSDIIKSIKSIYRRIEESRNNTNNRVEIYIDLIKSDDFKVVTDFCGNIEVIKNNINSEYYRRVKEGRKFVIQLAVTIFGILISLVGVIEKAPDGIKWLSKFFPSLSKYI